MVGDLGTLKSGVVMRFGVRLTSDASIWQWLVTHAGWLRARKCPTAAGQTPFEDMYERHRESPVLPFAQVVLSRSPARLPYWEAGPRQKPIRGCRVEEGTMAWSRSLEQREGVMTTRTTRRLDEASRADNKLQVLMGARDREATRDLSERARTLGPSTAVIEIVCKHSAASM